MSAFISGERRGDVFRSDRHSHLDAFAPSEPIRLIRIYAACTDGPCEQGRKLCPSPDACEVAELPDDRGASRALGWLCAVSAIVVAIGLIAAAWPALAP